MLYKILLATLIFLILICPEGIHGLANSIDTRTKLPQIDSYQYETDPSDITEQSETAKPSTRLPTKPPTTKLRATSTSKTKGTTQQTPRSTPTTHRVTSKTTSGLITENPNSSTQHSNASTTAASQTTETNDKTTAALPTTEQSGLSTGMIVIIVIIALIIFNCFSWLAYVLYTNRRPVLKIVDPRKRRGNQIEVRTSSTMPSMDSGTRDRRPRRGSPRHSSRSRSPTRSRSGYNSRHR